MVQEEAQNLPTFEVNIFSTYVLIISEILLSLIMLHGTRYHQVPGSVHIHDEITCVITEVIVTRFSIVKKK